MQYSGMIVFDLDDVLINFASTSFENYNRCAEAHGWNALSWNTFVNAHTYTWENKY